MISPRPPAMPHATSVSAADPKLIDASISLRGWSRIGTFLKCPQLFAYSRRLGVDLWGFATDKGSLGHIIQAHQHAHWGLEQSGQILAADHMYHDAADLYTPEEALSAACQKEPRLYQHYDLLLEIFRRYMARYPDPPGKIINVESQIIAVMGYKESPVFGSQWGLWVIDTQEFTTETQLEQALQSRLEFTTCDGEALRATPLDCPSHRAHGKPIYITRRVDLTVEANGRVWIWDHKHQASISGGKKVLAYAIDGGFALFRLMGAQLYGKRFGGIKLNLIQTQDPWRIQRVIVRATPHRDTHLADLIWEAEHRLAMTEVSHDDFWTWPKTMNESVCYGRFGACRAIDFCMHGKPSESS